MSKKRNDFLDVDAFVKELDSYDDEIPRDMFCPKCGSETWQELFYSKKTGKPNRCNECKSISTN